jgi:uncharacterized protein
MTRATFRERLKALLTLGESPQKLKLAFAVGVFIAFSPLVGIHTVLGVAVTWAFRFNPVAVMLGVFVNNPWTMAPIYLGGLWVGTMLWPPAAGLPPIHLEGLTFVDFLVQFKPYLVPFVLGCTLAGLVASAVGYGLMHLLISAYRKASGRAKAEG